MSRSEYLSTLPLWRRCLATLNWRPVYEIEQRTKQHEIAIEQLKKDNARLKELNSRLDSLLRTADSSSQAPPPTDCN
jgi:hypothetical protein